MDTITDVLNSWSNMGVFSYVLPFMLLFAVIFAFLEKTGILGKNNKSISVIVSLTISLMALQFEFVSSFFATIFPKFGVGLAIFLVLMLFVGFFIPEGERAKNLGWIGWVLGIGIVVWATFGFFQWSVAYESGIAWLGDYFWTLVLLVGMVVLIVLGVKGGNEKGK